MTKIDINVSAMGLRVSVFGAGYVGCVSAACLSNDGFRVVAVDPDSFKVSCLARGEAPIIEPDLAEFLEKANLNGMLTATTSAEEAVEMTNVSLCCVGTPSLLDGTLNTDYVRQVSFEIGRALRNKSEFHVVVMRSTILPGTMEEVVIPALEEASGKIAGVDFGVAYYPEFLRESSAIADYYRPGAIVFGQYGDDTRSIDVLKAMVAHISVVPHVIPLRSAEIVKYVNNCWHAVKISFANEIGNLCKAKDIDSHVVMDVVCADTRLNISKAYMKPGFAYGGSCLPKDLRALSGFGRRMNVATPMLDAAKAANLVQIDRAKQLISDARKDRIGFIGITFKTDTDDMRESPMLSLVENFIGNGKEVSIFDPNVVRDESEGRTYLRHIAPRVLPSINDVIDNADILVVGHKYAGLTGAIEAAGRPLVVVDLARVEVPNRSGHIVYHGLCW